VEVKCHFLLKNVEFNDYLFTSYVIYSFVQAPSIHLRILAVNEVQITAASHTVTLTSISVHSAVVYPDYVSIYVPRTRQLFLRRSFLRTACTG